MEHPVKVKIAKSVSEKSFYIHKYFLLFLLLLITFLCFLPVLQSDFIPTWDDNFYIIDNPVIKSITLSTIKQMFTTQVGGTYVPLPLLSYAIEYHFWGLNPVPFHVDNLVLHLICTLLVFQILRWLKLKNLYAASGALIYGIHPMGVESVAWVTERKDLLYGVFYFSSLYIYIRYVLSKSRKLLFFFLSLILFVLALFSKIQAVSLPLLLLLIDYYFQRPFTVKTNIEKIPYLVLSFVFGIAGILILKNVGALKINELFTLTERIFFGIYTLNAYILKFFAPLKLSVLYPYAITTGTTLPLLYYISPLFIILLGFLVYRTYRTTRAIVFGSLVFLFSVFFMLQIFGAGQGFLADRYIKVPYLGFVFLFGWSLDKVMVNKSRKKPFIWCLVAVFSIFLMIITYNRCKVWKNGETLWTDVIDKYPGREARPYACRGLYYRAQSDNDKALADMNRSLSLDNKDAEIMLFRGNIYFDKGMEDSAYLDYIHVKKLNHEDAIALGNLGAIYVKRNQLDSAVFYLSKSLKLDSAFATSYANRAVAFGGMGRLEESITDFKHYVSLKPNDEKVFTSIAIAYQRLGRNRESLEWFDKAIRLKPDFGSYYYFRSQSYKNMGDRSHALADAQMARDKGVDIPPEYLKSIQK